MNLASIAQELIRQSAKSIILNSNKRGLLQLPAGSRFTKEPISHDQLTKLLLQAAPQQDHAAIQRGKSPKPFTIVHAGQDFLVEVGSFGQSWSITIRRQPATEGAEASPSPRDHSASAQPEGNAVTTMPAAARTKPPDPAPQYTSLQGEVSYEITGSSCVDTGQDPEHLIGQPQDFSVGAGDNAISGNIGDIDGDDPIAKDATPSETAPSLSTPRTSAPHRAAPARSRTVPERSATALEPSPEPLLDEEPAAMMPGYSLAAGEEATIDPLLRKLVEHGASDLHLTAGMIPRYRKSGKVVNVPNEGVVSEETVQEMIYQIMPERVRKEYFETKDGDFAHSIEDVARFRVNVGVDRHGSYSVIRVIPNEILTPEQIGLPGSVLDLCYLTKGMVLVTGPTGSGKSTTLATLINVINDHREDHIITIEDPIEFVHPDNKKCLVRQREVGEHTGSFKRALKAALREDPDIVLVGEMRDLETIAIAIETAVTGHLVFGTLHTSTAPSTVDRVIDQFPANQQAQIRVMLSDALKGVIAQTLCKKIDGGMVAAFEILMVTPAVSNLIREGKTFQLYSTMQTSKGKGTITLTESLTNLVKKRIISAEEAYIKAVNKDELKDRLVQAGIRLNLKNLAAEYL